MDGRVHVELGLWMVVRSPGVEAAECGVKGQPERQLLGIWSCAGGELIAESREAFIERLLPFGEVGVTLTGWNRSALCTGWAQDMSLPEALPDRGSDEAKQLTHEVAPTDVGVRLNEGGAEVLSRDSKNRRNAMILRTLPAPGATQLTPTCADDPAAELDSEHAAEIYRQVRRRTSWLLTSPPADKSSRCYCPTPPRIIQQQVG